MEPKSSNPPLIAVVGETASGKSTLALELAEKFNGEIICADSWTVYKGFDIGTAKPTTAEQARIPHHLLNVADARTGFNAPQFQRLALLAIADINKRGKVPILSGGTGLYIDSVLLGYSFLPAVPVAERKARDERDLESLLEEANRAGINLDGIDVRNKRRVIRALETNGSRPLSTKMRPNTLVIGIKTERDDLRQRVAERVDKMFAAGLEEEVKGLAQKYGWSAEPMKGIGYREWQTYFSGGQTLDETKQKIINASMNLAKRQRTWFKRNNSTHWLTDPIQAVDLVTTFLNKKH